MSHMHYALHIWEGRQTKSHRKLWAWAGNSEQLCPSDEGYKRDRQARCRTVSCRPQKGQAGVGRERAIPSRKQRTMWFRSGTRNSWAAGFSGSGPSGQQQHKWVVPPRAGVPLRGLHYSTSHQVPPVQRMWVVDACKTHCHAQVLILRGSQNRWKLWAGSIPTRIQVMVDRFLSAPPLVFGLEFSPHTIQCNAICARWTGIFPPDECTSPYMPGRLEFSYLMMADWNFPAYKWSNGCWPQQCQFLAKTTSPNVNVTPST